MYLRAKLRNARGYYSMKLMLVGRGAQGKTTLMHRLMNDYTYNLNSATNGETIYMLLCNHSSIHSLIYLVSCFFSFSLPSIHPSVHSFMHLFSLFFLFSYLCIYPSMHPFIDSSISSLHGWYVYLSIHSQVFQWRNSESEKTCSTRNFSSECGILVARKITMPHINVSCLLSLFTF